MLSQLSRRDCLKWGSTGIGLYLIGPNSPQWLAAQQVPPDHQLIVRTETPLNAEPSLDKLLEHWITPTAAFFIRNHGTAPKIDAKGYKLTIDGLVEKPLTLGLSELTEQFGLHSVTATLTCSGNRRTEFNRVKKVPGVQWDAGAIGNAEWRGSRLSDVLKKAGIKPGAKHVWFEGLDEITEKGETFPFGGSIPLEKALADTPAAPGCLLATMMNGKPLTTEHGYPLRTIVPGFIGARSVKWLSKITVSDQPSPNHYLAHAYKVITEDTPAAVDAAPPIYEYPLNSIICSPAPNAMVSGERLTVRGVALSSGRTGTRIKTVEVSADGGSTWQSTRITSPIRDFCWLHWSVEVPLTPQTQSLLVRAVTTDDESQPQETPWNMKGYQYNGWHKVDLKVS